MGGYMLFSSTLLNKGRECGAVPTRTELSYGRIFKYVTIPTSFLKRGEEMWDISERPMSYGRKYVCVALYYFYLGKSTESS